MFKVYNNDTRTTHRRNDATANDVSDNSLTFFTFMQVFVHQKNCFIILWNFILNTFLVSKSKYFPKL